MLQIGNCGIIKFIFAHALQSHLQIKFNLRAPLALSENDQQRANVGKLGKQHPYAANSLTVLLILLVQKMAANTKLRPF